MRRFLRKLRQATTSLGRHDLWMSARNRAAGQLAAAARCHRRSLGSRVRIVAVAGTFGKTSTTRAISAVLGLPVPPSDRNLLGSVALRLLALPPWRRRAAFEVALGGPGQMAVFADLLRPDLVVVTSIGSEHNRAFGSLDATQAEKTRIVAALGPAGAAVLNRDDPRVWAMAQAAPGRVVSFGFDAGADVRAYAFELDWPHGIRFRAHLAGRSLAVRAPLLGRVMVYPCLAAIAIAWLEGLSLERAVAALAGLEPAPARLQIVPLPNGAWLIRDDFKSAEETIGAALDLLAEVPGRRIAVLGSVTDHSGAQGPIYRRLGERLAAMAAKVVVYGGQAKRYGVGLRAGGSPKEALIDAGREIGAAWRAVQCDLRPGDVVLVKGRTSERLDRIALSLLGHQVRCTIESCKITELRCEACPRLETGWKI